RCPKTSSVPTRARPFGATAHGSCGQFLISSTTKHECHELQPTRPKTLVLLPWPRSARPTAAGARTPTPRSSPATKPASTSSGFGMSRSRTRLASPTRRSSQRRSPTTYGRASSKSKTSWQTCRVEWGLRKTSSSDRLGELPTCELALHKRRLFATGYSLSSGGGVEPSPELREETSQVGKAIHLQSTDQCLNLLTGLCGNKWPKQVRPLAGAPLKDPKHFVRWDPEPS